MEEEKSTKSSDVEAIFKGHNFMHADICYTDILLFDLF